MCFIFIFFIYWCNGITISGESVLNVNPVTNNQNFEGKVTVIGKISKQQNYLFNLHRPALEKRVEDLPFDLLVEQSKSKKTISIYADVEGADKFVVHKNEQNFVSAGLKAISDGKNKSEVYKKMIEANEIINYEKQEWIYVLSGDFKNAREIHKNKAKLAIKNFDTYKQVTNFKVTNLPPDIDKMMFINSLKYKIYNAFSCKTPAERLLHKMNRNYYKNLKAKNIKIEPKVVPFQSLYY